MHRHQSVSIGVVQATGLLLINLGFSMCHVYLSEIGHFLFYTLKERFPNIFRLWVDDLQKYWPTIGNTAWFIDTGISGTRVKITHGFLRTFQHRVGLFLERSDTSLSNIGWRCFGNVGSNMFESCSPKDALGYRRVIRGSLLQNWFSRKRLQVIQIEIKHVTKSQNHNIEDNYCFGELKKIKDFPNKNITAEL